eukprot:gb/GECH01000859.1/.p1 GENE.gb/GECH01000859.1/~~gb/GECH01000859.1/.p1  ORF type:complete len:397 (+),score=74.70 gb/GECH01000859.1/:1-1191(+)
MEWLSAKESSTSQPTPSKRAFSSLTVLPFVPRRGIGIQTDTENNEEEEKIHDSNLTTILMFGGQHAVERGAVSFRDVYFLHLDSCLNTNWELVRCYGEFPCHRCGHTALLIPDTHKIILYGGFFHQALGDVYILDLDSKYWSSIQTLDSPPPRCGHVAEFINNDPKKMVVFGGYTLGIQRLNDLWLLDTTANLWREIQTNDTPRPSPRFYHSMVRLQPDLSDVGSDRLLVFGGRGDDNPDGSKKRFDDFHVLDTEKWEWKKINLPAACNPLGTRSSIATAHIPHARAIVCVGGCRGPAFNDTHILHYQMTSNRHTPSLSFNNTPEQPQQRPSAVYGRKCVPLPYTQKQALVLCWAGTGEITQEKTFTNDVDLLFVELSQFRRDVEKLFDQKTNTSK